MIFGYARVSTKDQNLDRQIVELKKYVPDEKNIYQDKRSGKDFQRAAYQHLKEITRAGDEIYIKSLDRLGRNKQQIKNELQHFKEKGVFVRIIDFPQTMMETKNKQQREIFDLITNIVIEVLGYVAETERENLRERQAEGIEVWRRTGKTKTGRPYGRPRKERPKNWNKIIKLWENKELQTKEAAGLLGVSRNTFYRLLKNE